MTGEERGEEMMEMRKETRLPTEKAEKDSQNEAFQQPVSAFGQCLRHLCLRISRFREGRHVLRTVRITTIR